MSNIILNRKQKNQKLNNGQQEIDIRSFMKIDNSFNDGHSVNQENNNQLPIFMPSNISIHQNQNLPNAIVDDNFMQFFQVNGLINHKYDNINKENRMNNTLSQIPKLSSEQLAELVLVFKVNHESEFLRELNVVDTGRKLMKQMDLCIEMLKLSIEMSPQQFKDLLNSLVAKHNKQTN